MWLGFAVALFVHGSFGTFVAGAAVHELGHGTVFRSRWLNQLFLYLFSLLAWWNPFDYGLSHTYHHRYTLHPEGDREVLLPLPRASGFIFLIQLFTITLYGHPERIFGRGGFVTAVVTIVKAALDIPDRTDTPAREWLRALHQDQFAEQRKSVWWSPLILLFQGAVVVVAIVSGLWVLPTCPSRAP